MSDTAIQIENLSKRYRIGKMERYKTIRDSLASAVTAPFRALQAIAQGKAPTEGDDGFIWSLKDITCEIKHGEVIGVIGRNGAGKSTLLKILSRITEPTSGRARLWGRVGALLEVGTGFHPELTGRENIFLNGAILNMKKADIHSKFDDIVAFSGVEKFIDTPVKHYSSGMHMRLAFAVAAHMEPDILMVDEVLAVGDAEFQAKCLGKMKSISGQGRTVLFVSHNMAAMAQLCQRGILLEKGRLVYQGPIRDVIETYLRGGLANQAETLYRDDPSKTVQIKKLQIYDAAGQLSSELDRMKPFKFVVEVQARENAAGTVIIALNTSQGVRLCLSVCADQFKSYATFEPGLLKRFSVMFPGDFLNEGSYQLLAWVVPGNMGTFDAVESPLFNVRDVTGRESFMGQRKADISVLRFKLDWTIE